MQAFRTLLAPAAFLLASLGVPAHATPLPSLVWNPGVAAPLPVWLEKVERTPGALLDDTVFHIRPAGQPGRALAITLYYEDGAGLFRALWSSPQGDVQLSGALLEGMPILNRRTLLVGESEVAPGGRLVIQNDAGSPRLRRVAFQWVEPLALYADDGARAPHVRLGTRDVDHAEAAGTPPQPLGDAALGRVAASVLQEAPVSLEDLPAFQATLEAIPDRILWECEIADLAPDQPATLWINDFPAGTLAVQLPDLGDPSWFRDASGASRIAGWRTARLWIHPRLLQAGANVFQVDALSPEGPQPVLRRVRLQTEYAPVPSAAPAPTAAPAPVAPSTPGPGPAPSSPEPVEIPAP